MVDPKTFNIDTPLWDLNTYGGRFRHYLWITDPRTCLASDEALYSAKTLVEQYRKGTHPPGTTKEQLIHAKKLYESAFHPDTGQKQNVVGRMSFQLPGNLMVGMPMLLWYRTLAAVLFWQWVNQSFNAMVNYTNRNAESELTPKQLGVAYISATSSALLAAVGFRKFIEKRASPAMERFVPFVAVAAANFANIPLMRQTEILYGVTLEDEKGQKACKSRVAAVKGISQVVVSRIIMAIPGMLGTPALFEVLEKQPWYPKHQALHVLFQMWVVGCVILVMVPATCALFTQRCSIKSASIERFESAEYEKLKKQYGGNIPVYLYFNKGL